MASSWTDQPLGSGPADQLNSVAEAEADGLGTTTEADGLAGGADAATFADDVGALAGEQPMRDIVIITMPPMTRIR